MKEFLLNLIGLSVLSKEDQENIKKTVHTLIENVTTPITSEPKEREELLCNLLKIAGLSSEIRTSFIEEHLEFAENCSSPDREAIRTLAGNTHQFFMLRNCAYSSLDNAAKRPLEKWDEKVAACDLVQRTLNEIKNCH